MANRYTFEEKDLGKLWRIDKNASKFAGGQVTIIGGSNLFHGAPILALRAASRVVDMVYFSTPVEMKGVVDEVKAMLSSFIWTDFEEVDRYIGKSDAVLIGPGLMRYSGEKGKDFDQVIDLEGRRTRELTLGLFNRFPKSRWVVDGGSLQVISDHELPENSVVTPNIKEFFMLFGQKLSMENLELAADVIEGIAKKRKLIIVVKGPSTIVTNGETTYYVNGGSAGLIKGGTGDIIAGLTAAFMAKNDSLLAACAANFLVKKAGELLEKERGVMYNADDVAIKVSEIYGSIV